MIDLIRIATDFIRDANPVAKAWITSFSLAIAIAVFFYKRDLEREDNCNEVTKKLNEQHIAEVAALNESFRARQDALEEEMIRDVISYKNAISSEIKKSKVEFNRVKATINEIDTKIKKENDYLETQLNNYENENSNITNNSN